MAIPAPTPMLGSMSKGNVGATKKPSAAKLVQPSPIRRNNLWLKRTVKTDINNPKNTPDSEPTEAVMLAVPTWTSKVWAMSIRSNWNVTVISQVESTASPRTGSRNLLCTLFSVEVAGKLLPMFACVELKMYLKHNLVHYEDASFLINFCSSLF
jgi:hypothetical protein